MRQSLATIPEKSSGGITVQLAKPENLSRETIDEIVEFLDTQETSHPFQYPQWARGKKEKYRASCRFAFARDAGKILWFASCGTLYPLGRAVARFRGLVINRGPVADDASIWRDALNSLANTADAHGYSFIEAAPDIVFGTKPGILEAFESGWNASAQATLSLRLGLQPSEDELREKFRKTTRHEIKNAESSGLSVVESCYKGAEVGRFLQLYKAMAGRKGFAADSPDDIERVLGWLSGDASRGCLLIACDQVGIHGGVVLVRAAKRCWYVWGATAAAERAGIGHLLQWNAIRWAKHHDCEEYDFGGYTMGATSGPALFKKGFGGKIVEFTPAQRRVVNESRYQSFRLLRILRGIK